MTRATSRRIQRIRKKSIKKQLDYLIGLHVDYGLECSHISTPPTKEGFKEFDGVSHVHPEILERYLNHEKVKLMLE